jgi:7-cyano-7-deazaguanine synthase
MKSSLEEVPYTKRDVPKLLSNTRVVATWSGGLDTTALIAYVIQEYRTAVQPLFVRRGQRAVTREENAVDYYSAFFEKYGSARFNYPVKITVDIPPRDFKQKLPFEHSHLLRNSDIVNQAVRLASSLDAKVIIVGSIEDDQAWRDGTLNYWEKKTYEVREGIGQPDMWIIAPFQEKKWSKADIIEWCVSASLDLSHTWSCYESGNIHCGECEGCRLRRTAFNQSGACDPTPYQKLLPI